MADFGIESAPPGVAQDAGTGDDIAPTVQAAVDMAMARREVLQEHHAGYPMPLPAAPDEDSSLLMPLPGVPIGPPADASNMGGRS